MVKTCYFASMNQTMRLILLGLLVFASRWFFLDAGYGAEEDAWGYAVNALAMDSTHSYQYSRLPGHPVPEWVYYFLPVKHSFAFNLCTALLSTIAVLLFYLICNKYKLNATAGALMLAFTPVFYIQSTNAMDYNWSLCFLLASLYFAGRRNIFLAALTLALATGCRITAILFILPLCIYLYKADKSWKHISQLLILTPILSALCYLPLILKYQLKFLTYVNQFGYPSVLKTIYKVSFGVWGTLGFVVVGIAFVFAVQNILFHQQSRKYKPILFGAFSAIIIYTLLFLYEPHKSAYLIPVIPFVILVILIAHQDKLWPMLVTTSLVLSCFFAGINLAEPNRSALPGKYALTRKVGNLRICFDPFSGNVSDDYAKRTQRIKYAVSVIEKAHLLQGRNAVICGYWVNMISILSIGQLNPQIMLLHYADEETLLKLKNENVGIYYLPEQAIYNDLCYKKKFTRQLAQNLMQ